VAVVETVGAGLAGDWVFIGFVRAGLAGDWVFIGFVRAGLAGDWVFRLAVPSIKAFAGKAGSHSKIPSSRI
jgi:hypothetical protein